MGHLTKDTTRQTYTGKSLQSRGELHNFMHFQIKFSFVHPRVAGIPIASAKFPTIGHCSLELKYILVLVYVSVSYSLNAFTVTVVQVVCAQ